MAEIQTIVGFMLLLISGLLWVRNATALPIPPYAGFSAVPVALTAVMTLAGLVTGARAAGRLRPRESGPTGRRAVCASQLAGMIVAAAAYFAYAAIGFNPASVIALSAAFLILLAPLILGSRPEHPEPARQVTCGAALSGLGVGLLLGQGMPQSRTQVLLAEIPGEVLSRTPPGTTGSASSHVSEVILGLAERGEARSALALLLELGDRLLETGKQPIGIEEQCGETARLVFEKLERISGSVRSNTIPPDEWFRAGRLLRRAITASGEPSASSSFPPAVATLRTLCKWESQALRHLAIDETRLALEVREFSRFLVERGLSVDIGDALSISTGLVVGLVRDLAGHGRPQDAVVVLGFLERLLERAATNGIELPALAQHSIAVALSGLQENLHLNRAIQGVLADLPLAEDRAALKDEFERSLHRITSRLEAARRVLHEREDSPYDAERRDIASRFRQLDLMAAVQLPVDGSIPEVFGSHEVRRVRALRVYQGQSLVAVSAWERGDHADYARTTGLSARLFATVVHLERQFCHSCRPRVASRTLSRPFRSGRARRARSGADLTEWIDAGELRGAPE